MCDKISSLSKQRKNINKYDLLINRKKEETSECREIWAYEIYVTEEFINTIVLLRSFSA